MAQNVLLLLGFSWGVNTCLNLFGYLKRGDQQLHNIDRPLDGRVFFLDGQRLLGDSTTLLGLFVAALSGLLIGLLTNTPLTLGTLAGLGVYAGHASGSFVKRRLHIASGNYMPILDHIDSVCALGMIYYSLEIISLPELGVAAILSALLQPVLCYIGYRLHVRERPL